MGGAPRYHRTGMYMDATISKHKALIRGCFNVGPPSTTLAQH